MTNLVLSIFIALLTTIYFGIRVIPAILKSVAIPRQFVPIANGGFIIIAFAMSFCVIMYALYLNDKVKIQFELDHLKQIENQMKAGLNNLKEDQDIAQQRLIDLKKKEAELELRNTQLSQKQQFQQPSNEPPATTTVSPAELGCGTYFLSAEQLAAHFGGHTWEGIIGNIKWQEYYVPHPHPSREDPGTFYAQGFKPQQPLQNPNWQGRWYLEGNSYCTCTGTCEEYACREVKQEVKQEGNCETRVWWTIEGSRKHSRITAMYPGDKYGLTR